MSRRKINRREFLRLSTTAAIGAVVAAACAPEPEVVTPEEAGVAEVAEAQPAVVEVAEGETPEGYMEPSMLVERANAGELPPIEERLPVNPVVLARPEIGQYGGEVRMIHFDPVWFVSNYGWNAERMLIYSDTDLKTLVPNIFESWEVSEDGKTFTFHMREGMKWSDGEPLTTEDVAFWWFDFATRDDLGSTSWHWRFGGELAELEVVDDYTFKVTFAAPFGQFPAHLTRWHMGQDFLLPKHYLKQYHVAYTDQAELDKMAQELGVENWQQVFFNKGAWGITIWQGPANVTEHPSLSPWVIKEQPEEGLFIWERNPYYWKVDQAGNQLPYFDNLRIDFVASTEIVTQKIIQGELDYVGPHDVSIARYPLYKENEEGNNYIVGDYLSCMTDRYTLFPQHNLEDKVLEEIVNHPNFVKALSVAIDREEINQSLYFGLARMGQLGPMPNSKYYKEAYGTAWAQYDPELANQLLDEMGLDQRDSEDFRLRPDGERLRYNIEHSGARVGVSTHEFTEMVVTFWRAIGIDATTKEEQESLYNERLVNGQVHCGVWHADRCTDLLLPLEWRWYIPVQINQGGPAQKWAQWFNAADREAEGLEEPPQEIKQLYEWHAQLNSTPDEDERVALGQNIFDYLAENPLSIGSVLESPAPLILNKNMRNLPRPKVPVGWDTYGISTYHPEAFFYEGGQRA
jgi:peptide/nickel transport system substrate-binding protein